MGALQSIASPQRQQQQRVEEEKTNAGQVEHDNTWEHRLRNGKTYPAVVSSTNLPLNQ